MVNQHLCAIVVLYFPDNSITARLDRIKNEVGAIVVIDNGGTEEKIVADIEDSENVYLYRNRTNLGVATALNQGVCRGEELGYEWFLLFDQDTEPLVGIGAELLEVYRQFCSGTSKALVGANYINGLGEVHLSCRDNSRWIERKTIITSGTLLSLEVYKLIGPFRDEFFIDAVDYDYCLRALGADVKVLITCRPLMRHSIGKQKKCSLAGKNTAVSNHNALRRYYMARNYVVLAGEYWSREPLWVYNRLKYLIKTMILISCFEKEKIPKLLALVKGVWHGAIKKYVY